MEHNSNRSTYLFVLPWSVSHLGGVNQVVINLAQEMIKSGAFDPLILICDWNAHDPIREEIQGLATVRWRIRSYQSAMSWKERLAYIFWERRFRRRFANFCRVNRVAAINPHYPGPTSLALERVVTSLGLKIPLLLSFHGADLATIQNAKPGEITRWRDALPRVHRVIACSRDLANNIASTLGNDLPIQVVHNGLDSAKFRSLSGVPVVMEGRMILNVAKFEDKKGQDVLIRAFATIANDFPDVKLVLVGSTDSKLEPLRDLCVQLKIDRRVLFFPDTPHHQVVEFFRRASLFVLPSRQEPFGIVLLEAGAFGLPVIASRIGGIPEIVEHGITGRLVPVEDTEALADCMAAVLRSSECAELMGARLRQHVEGNFAWSSALEKYCALVDSAKH